MLHLFNERKVNSTFQIFCYSPSNAIYIENPASEVCAGPEQLVFTETKLRLNFFHIRGFPGIMLVSWIIHSSIQIPDLSDKCLAQQDKVTNVTEFEHILSHPA